MTGIAIVGCGYVADKYMQSLPRYPELKLIGVFDREESRALKFSAYHGFSRFDSLERLLADERVAVVLNLTNPRSHFEVSSKCLRAGKTRLF
jgi:predicted dehydrogenase